MREELRAKMLRNAQEGSYYLNPDEGFLEELIDGLAMNEERFG